jgi:hypothetical protein
MAYPQNLVDGDTCKTHTYIPVILWVLSMKSWRNPFTHLEILPFQSQYFFSFICGEEQGSFYKKL